MPPTCKGGVDLGQLATCFLIAKTKVFAISILRQKVWLSGQEFLSRIRIGAVFVESGPESCDGFCTFVRFHPSLADAKRVSSRPDRRGNPGGLSSDSSDLDAARGIHPPHRHAAVRSRHGRITGRHASRPVAGAADCRARHPERRHEGRPARAAGVASNDAEPLSRPLNRRIQSRPQGRDAKRKP